MEKIFQYIEEHKQVFLDQWFEVLRIPSVSAQAAHKGDMLKTAEWLVGFLRDKLQMEAKIIPTNKHPLVYAESPKVPGAPTKP